MKKFKIGILIILALFLFPNIVNAEVEKEVVDPFEGLEIVSQTTKYYKVITYYDDSIFENGNILNGMNNVQSESIEITEAEYLNASVDDASIYEYRGNVTIETTYKRITSSIGKVGSNYRYVNSMSWKIIPSVRSYDIIGIGFLSNVQPVSAPNYSISYNYSGGGSGTYVFNATNTFNRGVSCTFKMPTSTSITSINMQLWVDVQKVNSGSTITFQTAVGDYSHATSTISFANAIKHEVIQNLGIVLDSSITSYYDTMSEAAATWYGTW